MQEMVVVGPACFDAAFYAARNTDLPPLTPADLWEHFVHDGQFEARPFRFACGAPPAGALPYDLRPDAYTLLDTGLARLHRCLQGTSSCRLKPCQSQRCSA